MEKYKSTVKCYKKGKSIQCSIPLTKKSGLQKDEDVYIIRVHDLDQQESEGKILENTIQEQENIIRELNIRIKEHKALNLDYKAKNYDKIREKYDKVNNDYQNELKDSKNISANLAKAFGLIGLYKEAINEYEQQSLWDRIRGKHPAIANKLKDADIDLTLQDKK